MEITTYKETLWNLYPLFLDIKDNSVWYVFAKQIPLISGS